jgi:uncharacterized protein
MMKDEKIPWYREPYVWLLIAFPLSAVIGGIITVALAIVSNDGLVVDDYYKEGLEINRVLKRDRTASNLEIHARLQFSPEHDRLRLYLSGNPEFRAPDKVLIHFLHSTRAGFDHQISATRDNNDMYGAEIPPLTRGNWYIQIETEDWRLLESITIR